MNSEEKKPLEIMAIRERNKPATEHKVRIVNGQPVCISCSYQHTIKLPTETHVSLAKLGEIVVKS